MHSSHTTPAARNAGDLKSIRHRFAACALCCLMLIGVGCGEDTPAPEAGSLRADLPLDIRPLNVVLLIVDTLRPDYLGCYGAGPEASPNVDRLAADGIVFENAFCHIPITGPSHATMFTGRYPTETGVLNNDEHTLPENIPLLAEIFQERGHSTGGAVSIPPLRASVGFDRGFDVYDNRFDRRLLISADEMVPRCGEVLDTLTEPCFFLAHFCDPHEPYRAHDLHDHAARLSINGVYRDSLTTSTFRVLDFDLQLPKAPCEIRLESDEPFRIRLFAMRAEGRKPPKFKPRHSTDDYVRSFVTTVNKRGPRNPLLSIGLSDHWSDTDDLRARYAREVAYVDQHLGTLLDDLRRRGLYDESLVIFCSDHGEALGENGGEVGHITRLRDTMLRVPLIIKPPRGDEFPVGIRRADLAGLVDLLPTILARAELPHLEGAHGRDLLAEGADAVEAVIFAETHTPQAPHTLFGLRDARYKVVQNIDRETWALRDLQDDPREERDFAEADPQLLEEWKLLLNGVRAGLLAPDGAAPTMDVSDETREKLRALGY